MDPEELAKKDPQRVLGKGRESCSHQWMEVKERISTDNPLEIYIVTTAVCKKCGRKILLSQGTFLDY
jgi:hypothetical protein